MSFKPSLWRARAIFSRRSRVAAAELAVDIIGTWQSSRWDVAPSIFELLGGNERHFFVGPLAMAEESPASGAEPLPLVVSLLESIRDMWIHARQQEPLRGFLRTAGRWGDEHLGGPLSDKTLLYAGALFCVLGLMIMLCSCRLAMKQKSAPRRPQQTETAKAKES
jgi:hypothetical protein